MTNADDARTNNSNEDAAFSFQVLAKVQNRQGEKGENIGKNGLFWASASSF